jgi:AcrR family transcriptional regulator
MLPPSAEIYQLTDKLVLAYAAVNGPRDPETHFGANAMPYAPLIDPMQTTQSAVPTKARKPMGRPGGPERRAAILEAAVDLFGEHGYRGAGLQALAKKVGISTAGILHHFGTKEGLLQALIDYRFEREADNYLPVLATGGRAAVEAMPRIAGDLLNGARFHRLFTVLIAENLSLGAPLHDHFVQVQRLGRQMTAAAIRAGVEHGEFRADIDPELIATEMVAFSIGIQNQWLLDQDTVRLTDTYEQYANALLERLAPH